ncbi:hypothetical protein CPB83DRAFT_864693 [Crepidotus variabilis]|uniref:F-box domain-containing protein n=1 Tax=Crepidotus variabilis TaxID=179855 RepID=A0A9P6E4C8_9AGAR|nr:hypothetical protein CPB83DRAFT_864693 [Crepidotus variabilis]
MSLPTEIIDHILSFLQDDANSLHICAEASSLMNSLIERHLYAHIILLPRETADNYNNHHVGLNRLQLATLLKTHPHIAHYIKSIQAVVMPTDLRRWTSALRPSYPKRDKTELSKPPYLPSLKNLTLNLASSIRSREVKWNLLPSPLRAYLKRIIILPSMEDITIQGIQDFPLQVLNGCPKLNRLALDGGCCTNSRDEAALPSGQDERLERARVRHLQVRRGLTKMHEIASWFAQDPHDSAQGIPDLSHLHSLDFGLGIEEFTLFAQILNVCSRTLEDITLEIDKSFSTTYRAHRSLSNPAATNLASLHNSPDVPYSLPSLINIKNLHIYIRLVSRASKSQSDGRIQKREYESPVPFISRIIEEIYDKRTSFALKNITINLSLIRTDSQSPTLAEIDFTALANIPLPGSSIRSCLLCQAYLRPHVATLVISVETYGYIVGGRQLQTDVERNQSLRPLMNEGKVSVKFIEAGQ